MTKGNNIDEIMSSIVKILKERKTSEPPFIDIPIEDAVELGFDINDGVPLFEDGSYYRFYRPDIKAEIERKKRNKQ